MQSAPRRFCPDSSELPVHPPLLQQLHQNEDTAHLVCDRAMHLFCIRAKAVAAFERAILHASKKLTRGITDFIWTFYTVGVTCPTVLKVRVWTL